jgi:hypothetical protein
MMKPDFTLSLGNFDFRHLEIPAEIKVGGDQKLVTHDLIGGVRVVDAMGTVNAPLEWSGLIQGPDALARNWQLDQMRVSGELQTLLWSDFLYSVVVSKYEATFQRSYQIQYKITCTVVQDCSHRPHTPSGKDVDQSVGEDVADAASLVAKVGDTQLTGIFGEMQAAMGKVSSFASASKSAMNSVMQPVTAMQARIHSLLASVQNAVQGVGASGGAAGSLLPANPAAAAIGRLSTQINGITQHGALFQLQALVGRISTNIASAATTGTALATAGGNLQKLATTAYGDATAWTAIAQANGLVDPMLTGLHNLIVPPKQNTTGGVVNS